MAKCLSKQPKLPSRLPRSFNPRLSASTDTVRPFTPRIASPLGRLHTPKLPPLTPEELSLARWMDLSG